MIHIYTSSFHLKIGPQSEIEFLESRIGFSYGWKNFQRGRKLTPFGSLVHWVYKHVIFTRTCTGVLALTTKKSLLPHGWLNSALFFRTLIHSDRVSRATMASPWATRIAAWLSRSPLSRTRENIFTPAVRGIKNAHLQQANASVCGQKISLDPLSWWHKMAIWGKQDIVAYATERSSWTNTRTHRKRAVVSSIKARIIFTNRTKKQNPTKPKSAKSTHPDEWMAQSRRETLKYAQGTLCILVLCSCNVLG